MNSAVERRRSLRSRTRVAAAKPVGSEEATTTAKAKKAGPTKKRKYAEFKKVDEDQPEEEK